MRVLVVDDDPQLVKALRINLQAHGYEVVTAGTARDALVEAAGGAPDAVILDLGLPDRDGLDVVAGLRGWSEVPIIVLSGRTGGPDKVGALDAGADDYVTKPFGMDELLARLRAVTRRSAADTPAGSGGEAIVRLSGVTVDLARRLVARDTVHGSEAVHLTPTEWHLLEVLARRPGTLLSQRYLLEEVWGPAYVTQPGNLRLYMAQLRHKLELDPSRPRHLLTEPGMGYRFVPDAGDGSPG